MKAVVIWITSSYGVKPEYKSKLFDQFFTAETVKGTGVGLAFSKSVMNAFGGDIACESEFGEYTEFTLTFPKVMEK